MAEQIKPLMQSTELLSRSDMTAISVRLGEVAILKGISLNEFQLKTWLREIESDLSKGVISVAGIKKALEEMPREKTYASLDYYSFYELAKERSNTIEKDVTRTKEYLEKLRGRRL